MRAQRRALGGCGAGFVPRCGSAGQATTTAESCTTELESSPGVGCHCYATSATRASRAPDACKAATKSRSSVCRAAPTMA